MKYIAAVLLGALPSILAGPIQLKKRGDDDWVSPVYNNLYSKPLFLPDAAVPIGSFQNETSGELFEFYEISIRPFEKEIYPGKLTKFVGYNGQAPGPTFKVNTGTRTVVRFVNYNDIPSSIHLHGAPSRPAFDGWAEDTISKGNYKDYIFPNVGGRTLWYHDHAIHETAVNAFYGQAGFYILRDNAKEALFNLPQGEYDIPLSIVDRIYKRDYQLLSPATEDDSYYGDVIHVNGIPWPYLNVEPRKYRFRLCDMSVSRSYKISIQDSKRVKLPMWVVATDAGFIINPISTQDLILGIAERYEIVVDFTNYAGQNLTMKNPRDFSKNEDFAKTDQIMQFRVGRTVTSQEGNGPLPAKLEESLNWPTKPTNSIDRSFKFESTNGMWKINGVAFAEVNKRILAKPKPGSTEIWRLENGSGGWAHPIHIHLVDFKVLTRSGSGRGVEKYEVGFKDTVFLDRHETATVIARFSPWKGEYMFHCHNLVHEDNDMMAAFDVGDTKNVVAMRDGFSDPMNPQWREKPYVAGISAKSVVETELLPYYSSLGVYDGFVKTANDF